MNEFLLQVSDMWLGVNFMDRLDQITIGKIIQNNMKSM